MREYLVNGRFSLAPAAGNTIYGRLAESADCATLRLPSYERALCPDRALAVRLGPDGLVTTPRPRTRRMSRRPAGRTPR